MKHGWLLTVGVVAFSAAVLAGVVLLVRPYLPASMAISGKAPQAASATPGSGTSPAASARFAVAADGKGIAGLTAPEGATIEALAPAGGVAAVRLLGVQSNAGSGARPGIFLRVPDGFETAASGQKIRVTVTARSAATTPSPAFAVSYSTAEVGNSGWQRFALTSEPTAFSFTYAVPKMNKGGGDYIGLLPDPAGAGGAIEVTEIGAEVLPAEAASQP